MGKLTNVSYLNTGGMVMCYSAMYDGRYWVHGATDGTMSAYSIDPLTTFDENGWYVDAEEYLVPDADDFPTWREVVESIRESGQYDPYGMDWVEQEILWWQEDLDKPVNVE